MIGKSGFVWVLASLEDVVFLYSDTREGDMVHAVLKDFRGVMVSDFYAVYDAFKCPQQKCLVHLMRDINDDMHRYPYDEELRELAQKYAAVLRIIVETVDRHGLKAHFLGKHLPAVEELFTWIATADFASEIAQSYRKRFHKNRDKLFTFLIELFAATKSGYSTRNLTRWSMDGRCRSRMLSAISKSTMRVASRHGAKKNCGTRLMTH
jgi:hypothetical protein